jgi:hypothetical protein
VNGENNITIGRATLTEGSNSMAFGGYASTYGIESTALGPYSNAFSDFTNGGATALGVQSRAVGVKCLAVGARAIASDNFSTAIGAYSEAKNSATVIGLGGYGDGYGLYLTPVPAGPGATMLIDSFTGRVVRSVSDDRVKINEVYIENATNTLLKLKPQKYDKLEDIGSSNVIGHESGLMAQDIWYDAPELRHVVYIPREGCEPTPEKPVASSDDPQDDPDYSAWGPTLSDVSYTMLVPYLVKSIQELNSRIKVLEGG